MKDKFTNVLISIISGIGGLVMIAVLIFGSIFLMSFCGHVLENYPYQCLSAVLAIILLIIIVRYLVVYYRIERALEHGIINKRTGTIYLIQKKSYKVGSYNIDMPWLEDAKYHFYNEYNMIPEEKLNDKTPNGDIRINRRNAIIVSREHLNAILKRKEFSLYKGNRQFNIVLTLDDLTN